jgi:hypothetical protein
MTKPQRFPFQWWNGISSKGVKSMSQNKMNKRAIQNARRDKAARRNVFSFVAADKRDGNEKRFY